MKLPAAEANWFVAMVNRLSQPTPIAPAGNPVPNLYGSASGKFHTVDVPIETSELLHILRLIMHPPHIAAEQSSVESDPNAAFLPRR